MHKLYPLFILVLFFIAFLIRLQIIYETPRSNYKLDLQIYQAGGVLITNGISPYDYSDKPALREVLRFQSTDPWIRENQDRWNYYASGNLPLNLLFFGLLSRIWHNPIFYRLAFAFFESLLSILVFVYVAENWKVSSKDAIGRCLRFVCTLLLGVLSLILLQWGTKFPQDKGIQILLILAAVVCAGSNKRILRTYFGVMLLGLSIAFKGLGVFVVPYYLSKVYKRDGFSVKSLGLFLVIIAVSTMVWFIPYHDDVKFMMLYRIQQNSSGLPGHSSMWLQVASFIPNAWNLFRIGLMIFVFILSVVGLLKRRLSILNFCGVWLLVFTAAYLLAGSLDRTHIGILLSTLFMGTQSIAAGFILTFFYVILGVVRFWFD